MIFSIKNAIDVTNIQLIYSPGIPEYDIST